MKKTILIASLFIFYIGSIIATYFCTRNAAGGSPKGADFKFDNIGVKVIAPSSFVLLGDKYRADIFLSAFSTSSQPDIETDTTSKSTIGINYKDGVYSCEVIADSEGLHQLNGKLKLKRPDGQFVSYPFKTEYMVAKPTAVIVPSDFVLYRGKENKIDVSIPGIASEDLYILVSNATVTGDKGKYTVSPSKESKCLISVIVKWKNGATKMLDQREYKVVDK